MQELFGDREIEGLTGERGVTTYFDQRAFEAADVFGNILRDEIDDIIGDDCIQATRLRAKDRSASFDIRHLNIGGEPPFETGNETGFEFGDFTGATITRKDDLFSRFEEIVKGVEEFFLDPLFACEELHVVEEQDIGVAIALTEFGETIFLQGLNKLVREFLSRKVGHASSGIGLEYRMTDGMHQVGLAEPGITVEEKRIVGLSGGLRDGEGGGVGHLVV